MTKASNRHSICRLQFPWLTASIDLKKDRANNLAMGIMAVEFPTSAVGKVNNYVLFVTVEDAL